MNNRRKQSGRDLLKVWHKQNISKSANRKVVIFKLDDLYSNLVWIKTCLSAPNSALIYGILLPKYIANKYYYTK